MSDYYEQTEDYPTWAKDEIITRLRAEVQHLQLIKASWIALKSELKYTPGGDLWPRAERVIELEQEIERLRRERDDMDIAQYQAQLETLIQCIHATDYEAENLEHERDEALKEVERLRAKYESGT